MKPPAPRKGGTGGARQDGDREEGAGKGTAPDGAGAGKTPEGAGQKRPGRSPALPRRRPGTGGLFTQAGRLRPQVRRVSRSL